MDKHGKQLRIWNGTGHTAETPTHSASKVISGREMQSLDPVDVNSCSGPASFPVARQAEKKDVFYQRKKT
jgi:hypothetical protein